MNTTKEDPKVADVLRSPSEAAKFLGVAEHTLAVWRCNARYDLPFVKVGRLVKYRQSALDKFLSDNTK